MTTWKDLPFAPQEGTPLCVVEDIPDGAGKEIVFGDGDNCFRLLLLRVHGELRAYHNRCPHFSIPLNYEPDVFHVFDGKVLMCAHHTAMFRIADGFCFDGPCAGSRLTPVPVSVDGDRVIVRGPRR